MYHSIGGSALTGGMAALDAPAEIRANPTADTRRARRRWAMMRGVSVLGVVALSACFNPVPNRQKCGDENRCAPGRMCNLGNCDVCFGDANGFDKICVPDDPARPFLKLDLIGPLQTDDVNQTLCTLMPQMDGLMPCVIIGSTITISGMFRVTGRYPLALIAKETVTVSGTLDVSSTSRTTPPYTGASADQTCDAKNRGSNDSGGGGGGAGGSFGAQGGSGGSGNVDGTPALGGSPGLAQNRATTLRGGCPGGDGGGGTDDSASSGGAGGKGGGAVYVIANQTIVIRGSIFASGASGLEGPMGNAMTHAIKGGGAGGGGSGGMIVLDAPMVQVFGQVVANGGGGGGGGLEGDKGQPGSDGDSDSDGNSDAWKTPAGGGIGTPAPPGATGQYPNGGNGGAGGALGSPDGAPGLKSNGGGGGGGGSVGIILIHGPLPPSDAKISPKPTLLP